MKIGLVMQSFILFLGILITVSTNGVEIVVPDDYSVYNSILLTAGQSKNKSKIQLFRHRSQMKDKQTLISSRPDRFLESDRHLAILRLVDANNNVLSIERLEKSRANLGLVLKPSKHHTFYMIEVDYSIDFGSYNGPITFLFSITDNKIDWTADSDVDTGKSRQIALMKSLKSSWILLESGDILKKACRPGPHIDPEKKLPFFVHYSRYHFDGGKWLSKTTVQRQVGVPLRDN